MNARGIKLGTKLKFNLINSMGEKISETYTSKFVDILGDNEMAIISPLNKLKLMFMPLDSRIKACFFHEEHGQLNFTGSIIFKDVDNTPMLLHIRIDEDCMKIQKRKYYRPDFFLDAQYCIYKDLDSDIEADLIPDKNALTKNICYRGVCLITDEDIAKHYKINLNINLNPNTTINMKCEIVRKAQLDGRYEYGLQVIQMCEADQQALKLFITNSAIIY